MLPHGLAVPEPSLTLKYFVTYMVIWLCHYHFVWTERQEKGTVTILAKRRGVYRKKRMQKPCRDQVGPRPEGLVGISDRNQQARKQR